MNISTQKIRTSLLKSYTLIGSFLITGAVAHAQPVMSVQLKNPLKVTSITELLEALLGVVLVLATPIIVFFIIYSGFLYVTAQGNAEQVKQATRSLTYAIIGGVIVIGAFAIATMVKNLVASF